MLSASSPEQARSGVVDIVNNVGSKGGAGAAVSVANPNLTPGDNFAYASSYNSGAWSGDINKFAIDLTTGFQSTTPTWDPSPQKQLANRETSADRHPQAHDHHLRRHQRPAVPVGEPDHRPAHQPEQRHRHPRASCAATARRKWRSSARAARVRTSPLSPPAFTSGVTPNNISVLGSIINAEPIVVGPPLLRYFDHGYSTYPHGKRLALGRGLPGCQRRHAARLRRRHGCRKLGLRPELRLPEPEEPVGPQFLLASLRGRRDAQLHRRRLRLHEPASRRAPIRPTGGR